MARLLSNSIARTLTRPVFSPPLPLTLRHRSNSNRSGDGSGEPPHPQLIEIDLDCSSSGESDGGIRKLEEVIHSVIVRRSAPDWLPFLPGSSYWVPPPQPYVKVGGGGGVVHSHRGADFDPHRILEVVGKMAAVKGHFGGGSSSMSLLSEDETRSVARLRGWPSSSFFTGAPTIHDRQTDTDDDVGAPATGNTFPSPVQMVEVEVKLEDNSDYDSKSEDEG
ncbi:uncharacterized protein LOC107877881 isoform X1 [Capsicum annuum]|uniref:uncharacterized protein LOC107877881 isoform X1 n=1 Tax=Capsicum annuum TaxID=4072 RepID=UPI001FB0C44E|nr:uncharacterized protein LOC107877881 isoform X1 [Capsicum annuum]